MKKHVALKLIIFGSILFLCIWAIWVINLNSNKSYTEKFDIKKYISLEGNITIAIGREEKVFAGDERLKYIELISNLDLSRLIEPTPTLAPGYRRALESINERGESELVFSLKGEDEVIIYIPSEDLELHYRLSEDEGKKLIASFEEFFYK